MSSDETSTALPSAAVGLWSSAYCETEKRRGLIIRDPYALSFQELCVEIALAGADAQLRDPLKIDGARNLKRPVDLPTQAAWLINAALARFCRETPRFLPGDTVSVSADARVFLLQNSELEPDADYRVSTIWYSPRKDPEWEVCIHLPNDKSTRGYDASHFKKVREGKGKLVQF